jgi:hypothetical protein
MFSGLPLIADLRRRRWRPAGFCLTGYTPRATSLDWLHGHGTPHKSPQITARRSEAQRRARYATWKARATALLGSAHDMLEREWLSNLSGRLRIGPLVKPVEASGRSGVKLIQIVGPLAIMPGGQNPSVLRRYRGMSNILQPVVRCPASPTSAAGQNR